MFSVSGNTQNDQMTFWITAVVSPGEIICSSASKKLQSVELKLLEIDVKILQEAYSINNVIPSFSLHPQGHILAMGQNDMVSLVSWSLLITRNILPIEQNKCYLKEDSL